MYAKNIVLLRSNWIIMRKFVFLCLLVCPLWLMADELSNILNGEYKARTLTTDEMDSIMRSQMPASKVEKLRSPRFVLEYENKHSLYRRSFEADYYIVDRQKGTRTHLSDGPVRDAVISPNNKYVVYAKENNLYIFKLDFMTEVPITTNNGQRTVIGADGAQKRECFIFNGIADWLYEEEFGSTRLFEFSPDSKQLAFVRLDEMDVESFQWQEMLSGNYPTTKAIRYPKAGTVNARASVCVYDIYYKTVKTMDLGEMKDCYIPRMKWTNPVAKGKEVAEPQLLVQKVNRDQTEISVYLANAKSTISWLLNKENSEQYFMNYELFDQWQWLSDGRFILLSESKGWIQAYLCNPQGQMLRCLTPDGMDVTKVYGVDEKTQILYYQAANTPLTRQCYAVDLKKGAITQLTEEEGIHDLYFAEDYTMVIDNFENEYTPNRYTLYDLKGSKMILNLEVEDNSAVAMKWELSQLPHKEFMRIATERGDSLDAWQILPANFDSTKRYPVVLMQYSGPQSQRVLNRWKKGFGHYLASQGYVVINADPRGTDARGREWRNKTYMHLGQKEAEDQLSVAHYAARLPYVDADRIAIIGWSYGGYQVVRTMCGAQSNIKCGVAIAPVTDWRLYDSGYTERFMRRPQVNETGYNAADLTAMAGQLNGRLLLVHGLADDNVHAQNTFRLVESLVQAGKQFDMQIYPDDNHFLRQRANYEHLHQRMLLFLKENL